MTCLMLSSNDLKPLPCYRYLVLYPLSYPPFVQNHKFQAGCLFVSGEYLVMMQCTSSPRLGHHDKSEHKSPFEYEKLYNINNSFISSGKLLKPVKEI